MSDTSDSVMSAEDGLDAGHRNTVGRVTRSGSASSAPSSAPPAVAAILEGISDCFIALDRSWRYIYLNGPAEKNLRRSREELLGRCIWEEFPEAASTKFYTEFHRALEQNTPVRFEEYYAPFDVWDEV